MFLEDLLTWIDGFASEEGPRLIAEGGKFAVGQSFVPIAQQLQRLVQGLTSTPQSSLPPGFKTTRVKTRWRISLTPCNSSSASPHRFHM